MLIEFKVANYRSIREEQTLSFVASNYSDELLENLIPLELPGVKKGTRLLNAAAIYGANASGKSNLLAALGFLVGFVKNSATGKKPDASTGTEPFKLDPAGQETPTRFELQAMVDGLRMLYGVELTRRRITKEYLVAYPKGRATVWFERDWNPEREKYSWSKSSEHFQHDEALRGKVRENASFLATAAQFNHAKARAIWNWFETAFHFAADDDRLTSPDSFAELLEKDQWRVAAVQALTRADFGILDATLRQPHFDPHTNPKTQEFREHLRKAMAALDDKLGQSFDSAIDKLGAASTPLLIHRGKGGASVPMEFELEESRGTRRFLALLGECLRDAEHERVMIVDELEASLHPLLVREIIQLFTTFAARSGRCAQLLFTTHNPLLLDQTLLRRDQIWFAEKDDEGATRLYPLTDYAPRKDESLVKGYLAGRYGGIPFIPEHLTFGQDAGKAAPAEHRLPALPTFAFKKAPVKPRHRQPKSAKKRD